jgi:hypothetical protein
VNPGGKYKSSPLAKWDRIGENSNNSVLVIESATAECTFGFTNNPVELFHFTDKYIKLLKLADRHTAS